MNFWSSRSHRQSRASVPESLLSSSPPSSTADAFSVTSGTTLGISPEPLSFADTSSTYTGQDNGFLVVSDPEQAEFDFVLVHGLIGHRQRTWTHSDTHFFWPSLLARDFPSARVLSYGYDSRCIGPSRPHDKTYRLTHDSVQGFARKFAQDLCFARGSDLTRPVIFVAHSLGGLLVKQALLCCLRAANGSSQAQLLTSTHGILFLGTPHFGSDLAKHAERLAQVVRHTRGDETNKLLLQYLRTDSLMAREDHVEFAELLDRCKHIEVCCVYETKVKDRIGKSKVMVVSKESACIPGKMQYPMNKDHCGLSKFASEGDNDLNAIFGFMRDWCQMVRLEKGMTEEGSEEQGERLKQQQQQQQPVPEQLRQEGTLSPPSASAASPAAAAAAAESRRASASAGVGPDGARYVPPQQQIFNVQHASGVVHIGPTIAGSTTIHNYVSRPYAT